MKLFEHGQKKRMREESPLANRLRPETLDEYVGQGHLIGRGRLLRRAIEADQLSSLIFYGPPGTGKTTLAMVIANTTKSHFEVLNAVMSGVKQLREVVAAATERQQLYGTRTTLFVDEVHRWNKAQQDALLPYVEKGVVILIGATTENPYFEVNKALVSRSRIFQLRPLTENDLRRIAQQALADEARGYGRLEVDLQEAALDHLVNIANGDARTLLNALELAVETTPPNEAEVIEVTLAVAEESIQRRAVLYDKDGDAHYDHISAFIKSLRGSDPDAALYWAAKMIYAGEEPTFLFRRMGIFAGEDIGMADPQAAVVVESCWALFERIGMPEGQFPLAQAILYLATAPKSNTAFSFFDALKQVEEEGDSDVPNHLRDANRDAKGFGHGAGYKYPHSYHEHWVAQQYLPSSMQGRVFYQPSQMGVEGERAADVLRRREAQLAMLQMAEEDVAEFTAEILTTSPVQKGKEEWLQRTMSNTGETLGRIRDKLFEMARLARHHLVADVQADHGLLLWEAVRQVPEGGVWGVAEKKQEMLEEQAQRLQALDRPQIVPSLGILQGTAVQFDRLVAYNALTRLSEQQEQAKGWLDVLADEGFMVLAQTVPREGQRIWALVDWSGYEEVCEVVATAEERLWTAERPMTSWGAAELEDVLVAQGWVVEKEVVALSDERRLPAALVRRWFEDENPYQQALLEDGLTSEQIKWVQRLYRTQLENQTVLWKTTVAFMLLRKR